jgi:glyoxylase-like metal-dependent hydrolase (beta-lactamase superfamily II)
MRLFFHYCQFGFSNCYLLGTELSAGEDGKVRRNAPSKQASRREASLPKAPLREAIIVDPGNMDETILNLIELNKYTLRGVLITHDHLNHVHGLRTLKRIYDTNIYAVNHVILEHKTSMVKDGDTLKLGPFVIEVISVPGHSSDSAVFKIGHLLFTGDALSAGLVGTTASSYGAEVQMTALRSRILSLPGNYVVLPGHGPPTSLEVERRFNAGIQFYEQSKNKRQPFTMEIWD